MHVCVTGPYPHMQLDNTHTHLLDIMVNVAMVTCICPMKSSVVDALYHTVTSLYNSVALVFLFVCLFVIEFLHLFFISLKCQLSLSLGESPLFFSSSFSTFSVTRHINAACVMGIIA